MNLKESFRYQTFLSSLMRSAIGSISIKEHSLNTVKCHRRSKANPEATDITEMVDNGIFPSNDSVIRFMEYLVDARAALTTAINKAKQSLPFDLDAAVEANKFRRSVNGGIGMMLRHVASQQTSKGQDYKFNAEGNQSAYYYDIEVTNAEAYDRDNAKKVMRSMISEADKVASKIDAALINTTVDYVAPFDVNDSFEDVIASFNEKLAKP